MNEQSPINDPEPLDRREARRQRREERLEDPSRTGTWTVGLILILLGGMFLMRNMGTFTFPLQNWWALFILIPAIGAIDSALRTYRHADNQWTASARGSLGVGIILTLVTIMFLFDLSWTYFGPALIILAGIGILVNAGFRQ
jgi:peptidoglycan/LPS O-acetylase OafA/YrhL